LGLLFPFRGNQLIELLDTLRYRGAGLGYRWPLPKAQENTLADATLDSVVFNELEVVLTLHDFASDEHPVPHTLSAATGSHLHVQVAGHRAIGAR
jgi:hypothetical protein